MPELDGLGAIEKIRAGEVGEKARSLWIAVLTADAARGAEGTGPRRRRERLPRQAGKPD